MGAQTRIPSVASNLHFAFSRCRAPHALPALVVAGLQTRVLLSFVILPLDPVELHFQWRPQVRDPGDEMVLEAAINREADAIVTYNVRDFALIQERFGILVAPPGEILRRVKR